MREEGLNPSLLWMTKVTGFHQEIPVGSLILCYLADRLSWINGLHGTKNLPNPWVMCYDGTVGIKNVHRILVKKKSINWSWFLLRQSLLINWLAETFTRWTGENLKRYMRKENLKATFINLHLNFTISKYASSFIIRYHQLQSFIGNWFSKAKFQLFTRKCSAS